MNYKFSSSLVEKINENLSIISLIERSHKIYFIGISGIGMSALARLFKGIGKHVSGSSDLENDQTKSLKSEGVNVFIGHKVENLSKDIELVIKSEAIPDNNIEIITAEKLNIPIITYGEGLSFFFNKFKSVAITGTHGKSSVSGILVDSLWDTDRISYLVGTNVKKTKKNGAFKGILFIGEACEYKETFSNFYPDTIIIPSLEMDHVDYYKNKKNYLNAFKDFILHLKGENKIILHVSTYEEIQLLEFIVSLPFIKNYYFYSDFMKIHELINILSKKVNIDILKKILSHLYFYNYKGKSKIFNSEKVFLTEVYKVKNVNNALKYIKNLKELKKEKIFNYKEFYKKETELLFPFPSKEYAANITSVYIFLKTLGFSKKKIFDLIKGYKGIERRFDIMGIDKNRNIVINDYAHHPSEIKTFLKMVKQKYPDKKTISIFQPHQYSRTYYLFKGFINSFNIPDHVIFLPIYKQRDTEEDIKRISHNNLCFEISKKRDRVNCFDIEQQLFDFLEKFSESVILFIGAGSIIDIARRYFNKNKL